MWSDSETTEILKCLAVTCELTGTTYSEAARRVILDELRRYDAPQVLEALRKCGSECEGRLSLGVITKQLNFIDRKQLADARAARMHDETQLRMLALDNRIPWESGKERVREQLIALGYKLDPPEKPTRNLPHWTEEPDP